MYDMNNMNKLCSELKVVNATFLEQINFTRKDLNLSNATGNTQSLNRDH